MRKKKVKERKERKKMREKESEINSDDVSYAIFIN